MAWKWPVIETLDALPALTRSWLAPLEADDPELYAELADTLVIGPADASSVGPVPADARDVLAALDLRGKELGAFRFAPAEGDRAADRIAQYDRSVRETFDAGPEITFIGDHGNGSLFLSPEGVGLLDFSGREPRIVVLAPSFETFLLAQANAYDAYKRNIVEEENEQAYRAAASACAALPYYSTTDVPAIFEAQLRS